MTAGQRSGTGGKTRLHDDLRKDDIPERDKSHRPVSRGLDGKRAQGDEQKDTSTNRRSPGALTKSRVNKPDETAKTAQVDRPGFDLGGSTGETDAGKGLGLGDDAKENRKGWKLPR